MNYPTPGTVPHFAAPPANLTPNPSPQLTGYEQAIQAAQGQARVPLDPAGAQRVDESIRLLSARDESAASFAAPQSLERPTLTDAETGLTLVTSPADPKVGDKVQILGTAKPAPAPRKKPATSTSTPQARVGAPRVPEHRDTPAATATPKRAKTGAGARPSGDHIWIYTTANYGILAVALAAIAISWNGLSAVGSWLLLPPYMTWLLPVAIDVALIVFTIGVLPRKTRGESTWQLKIAAVLLSTISAAANFSHVVLDAPEGTPDLQRYAGASLAAFMPFLALITTEVLGMLITKPTRAERAREKLATQKAEAALKKPAAKRKSK